MKEFHNPQPSELEPLNPLKGDLKKIERPSSFLPSQGQGVQSGVSRGVSSINLNPEHLKIVKEILFQFIPNTEVWAFGSRVKFTNADFADLDLVIVGENKQSLSTMADLEEAFKESDLPFEVDILDYCSIAEHLKKEINKKYVKLIDPKSVKEGYKDTPLGLIPEDWEVMRLGDVGEIYSGGTPDTNNLDYWGGEIFWVTPTEVTALNGKKYISSTGRTITDEGLKNSSAKLLPPYSVIVCTRATVGDCCINLVPMSTNQGFKSIVLKNKAEVDFLYFLICSFKQTLIELGSGSTFLEVSKKDFENITIPLPPLEEQKKIAEILSTWDQGIDKLSGLIERKKHLKKGLMQKLLTGRVRVKPPSPLKGEFLGLTNPRVFDCADKKLYEKLKLKAQDMRHNPTKAEAILWESLKDNSLGVKFRRQHIINRYIVDFYCVEKSLIVELDGEIHEEQKEEDQQRQEFLESLGCHAIRFKNDEVFENLELVLSKMKNKLSEKPSGGSLNLTASPKRLLKGDNTQSSPFRGLGGYPEDWEVVRLGDVGKFAKGKGIRKDQVIDNGIPCIRYGEIYTQHHEYIKKFYSFIDDEIARESQRIEKGDILFAGSGETTEEIGKCVAYTFPQEAYAGGDIIIFSPSNAFNSLFLGFLLNSEEINTQKSVMGQGNSVVHIYSSSLSNLQIPLPPLEEQKKIAEILSTQDKEINDLEKKLELFKQQKKGLMQILLTGRVRV